MFDERHDTSIVHRCKCKENKIILKSGHTEYKYFETTKNTHPYLKQVINDLEK
jgi:hypothetical protein